MRSVELVLDAESDAAIRAEWAALAQLGLPSLASHTAASNRPHVTVAAGAELEDSDGLRGGLTVPMDFSFGGLLLFPLGRERFVLARSIVTDDALLELHASVHRAVGGAVQQTLPGSWTPHVTLSRRLTADQVGVALGVLGDVDGGTFTGARLWDGELKEITELAP